MAAKTDIAQTSISAGQQMEFWRLASNPNSHVNAKTFQAFLEAKNPFEQTVQSSNILTVTSSTILQMITAGKYDSANENIVKKFSFNAATIGDWEFRLIAPKGEISSDKAKKLCEESLWQAGGIEHLLAFIAAFPDLQRVNSIIALGSECQLDGVRHVPGLWSVGDGRGLGLFWWCGVLGRSYRFLSVRKVSNT